MRTLSKDAEEKIIAAVKRAVALVDRDGMTPDDAIEKVAREEKWTPHLIRFASYAYNTGRQTAQRQLASSARDKFASFPIVDPEKVISRIWPDKVKSGEDELFLKASSEYERPPAWISEKEYDALRARTMTKKAAAQPAAAPQEPPLPQQAYSEYCRLKRAAEEARSRASAAYDRLLGSMGRLTEYFQRDLRDRLPVDHVKAAAEARHGQAVKHMFAYVGKKAETTEKPPLLEWQSNREPWSLIDECVAAAADVATWRSKQAEYVTKAEAVVYCHMLPFVGARKIVKSGSVLIPEEPVSYYDDANLPLFVGQLPRVTVQQKKAQSAVPLRTETPAPQNILVGAAKEAGLPFSDVAQKTVERIEEGADDAAKSMQKKLLDPMHEASMRKIRTQALLTQMLSDEVIGSYAPAEVLKAYNEIQSLAPRLSEQPLALRALLRRRLQGGLEPFEAKELVDAERKFMQTVSNVRGGGSDD